MRISMDKFDIFFTTAHRFPAYRKVLSIVDKNWLQLILLLKLSIINIKVDRELA